MEENKQIAETLIYQARLMEVIGRDHRRTSMFRTAGNVLRKLETPAEQLLAKGSLQDVKGIGPAMSVVVREIVETGTARELVELEERIPEGVREMLTLSGLGPKKVAVIWREMGIETVGELHYACIENRLVEVKGFGLKTQERLLKTIEFLRSNQYRFLYADLYPHYIEIKTLLTSKFGSDAQISLTGEMRRLVPALDKIQFLAAPGLFKDLMLLLIQEPQYEILTASSDLLQACVRGTQITFEFLFKGIDFYRELFLSTGSEAHTERIPLETGVIYGSEEEIYEVARITYVPPELREGAEEVRLAYRDALPRLVDQKDIKGLLHAHSNWSDGLHSIAEMAEACKALGMEYLGLSDHSQSAKQANGLSPERVLAQHAEIEALNEQFSDFRILKGIESDILPNGDLDYNALELAGFDFVIASIHSKLDMDKEEATTRLLKAISNPYTNILGHPTGRLLLTRSAYPIDHAAIIQACAAYDVAIELNCNPNRLDLDWAWIRYAVECGVYISINPNAHRKESLTDYLWGLNVARKGLLSPELTLNAMPLAAIEEFFLGKRKRRIV